ncbi:hypothetical protein F5Y12DRAFT_136873 [Xylaria sp. FL1777]|nr:hypothetical protein F5Y12DRAFT_136873 [Xylaria sp. FL1777]
MVTAAGTLVPALKFHNKMSNTSSFNAFLLQADTADIGNGDGSADDNLPGQTITLPTSFWWEAGATVGAENPITAAYHSPCVFILPPLTYPVLQPPPFTTSWGGQAHTVTPPLLINATYTINPITWGTIPTGGITTTNSEGSTTTILPPPTGITTITTTGSAGSTITTTYTPPTGSATTTTTGVIVIITPDSDQTEIPIPPWTTRPSGEDSDRTIHFPPIPIPWPSHGSCLFACGGKPKLPGIIPKPDKSLFYIALCILGNLISTQATDPIQ